MRNALFLGALLWTVSVHAQSIAQSSLMTVEAHHLAASTKSEAGTLPSATSGNTASSAPRPSTGVVGPTLISEPVLKISAAEIQGNNPGLKTLVVAFTVNQEGKPKNVHIVKPLNPSIDSRILCAVGGYRFTPATLNDKKIAVDIRMTINFEVRDPVK